MDLQGRIALITGSTAGGIGRSTAITLAGRGADIVLNYGTNRADDDADHQARVVEAAIRDLGRRVLLVKADTRDGDAVTDMVGQAVDEFGKLDIVVANASGAWNFKGITEMTLEEFRDGMDAELHGAYALVHACLPVMRRNRWGRIVLLGVYGAGIDARDPADFHIGKGARHLLAQHLARQERPHNITANLVSPGAGHTEHFGTMDEALTYAAHGDEWSRRERCTPQDIADAIAYLCSEQGRFVNGSQLSFAIE
ncbi:SDR family oxidoreductase [Candidatus Poribacteria bacterium]|nr:SDR family oxidoreductase [Candidatus Poribacteria bacterium]MBT5536431.1 SDR family oxidoreductase [Candidatus Poribacteria bacterium]MBT5710561.1 SDR family oxidoreductase [Candidatus Poribacteria bacterium]MBT7098846.1 SDR family oxidoreductase [Candidatus Poribacteria bacterium]MBT7805338.1 SDR family oxidoreductase [Candidatus Poribacteria bacterium]